MILLNTRKALKKRSLKIVIKVDDVSQKAAWVRHDNKRTPARDGTWSSVKRRAGRDETPPAGPPTASHGAAPTRLAAAAAAGPDDFHE